MTIPNPAGGHADRPLYRPGCHDRVAVRCVANPSALPLAGGVPDHRPYFVGGTVLALGIRGDSAVVQCDDGTERRVHVEDLDPETPDPSTSARRAA